MTEPDIPNLEQAEQQGTLMFVPLGGNNLELWVTRLAGLNRPEFYLTDRDQAPPSPPKYHREMEQWNARGCIAWVTSKRELENYLHPTVLATEAPGYAGTGAAFEDVPMLFAEAVHSAAQGAPAWAAIPPERKKDKASSAKKRLNTACVARMTPALLTQADPNDELRNWLREIGRTLRS